METIDLIPEPPWYCCTKEKVEMLVKIANKWSELGENDLSNKAFHKAIQLAASGERRVDKHTEFFLELFNYKNLKQMDEIYEAIQTVKEAYYVKKSVDSAIKTRKIKDLLDANQFDEATKIGKDYGNWYKRLLINKLIEVEKYDLAIDITDGYRPDLGGDKKAYKNNVYSKISSIYSESGEYYKALKLISKIKYDSYLQIEGLIKLSDNYTGSDQKMDDDIKNIISKSFFYEPRNQR